MKILTQNAPTFLLEAVTLEGFGFVVAVIIVVASFVLLLAWGTFLGNPKAIGNYLIVWICVVTATSLIYASTTGAERQSNIEKTQQSIENEYSINITGDRLKEGLLSSYELDSERASTYPLRRNENTASHLGIDLSLPSETFLMNYSYKNENYSTEVTLTRWITPKENVEMRLFMLENDTQSSSRSSPEPA